MAQTIAGALVGGALRAYGEKTVIPPLPEIDVSKLQLDTIGANAAALPSAQSLGASVDQYNLDQLQKALDFWSPGSLGKLQSTIAAQLSGQLDPEDTQSLISSATASGYGKGFGASFGQGGIGRNLTLRDLGLGIEATKERGMANLLKLNQAGPSKFDVTSMFFTPQQRTALAFQDRTQRFQRDLLAAQVQAAPNPNDVALAEGFDNFFKFWSSIGGAALGNVGGLTGGGGGGMMGGGSSASGAAAGGVRMYDWGGLSGWHSD
jgi:hypothetical protein